MSGGCSPILGPDRKIHVFYSKWPNAAQHQGWLTCCEIDHAVADQLAGPYTVLDSAIKGRGGDWWDAKTCHNPTIHSVGDQYALFYMGTVSEAQTVLSVWLNGLASGTNVITPGVNAPHKAIIGEAVLGAWKNVQGTLDREMMGQLDDVRVYDRALSAGELAGQAGLADVMDVPFE
jgi:hypothetical protein